MDDKQPARMFYELNYESVDQDVNSFVIANGLNKEEFRYLLPSYKSTTEIHYLHITISMIKSVLFLTIVIHISAG